MLLCKHVATNRGHRYLALGAIVYGDVRFGLRSKKKKKKKKWGFPAQKVLAVMPEAINSFFNLAHGGQKLLGQYCLL